MTVQCHSQIRTVRRTIISSEQVIDWVHMVNMVITAMIWVTMMFLDVDDVIITEAEIRFFAVNNFPFYERLQQTDRKSTQ